MWTTGTIVAVVGFGLALVEMLGLTPKLERILVAIADGLDTSARSIIRESKSRHVLVFACVFSLLPGPLVLMGLGAYAENYFPQAINAVDWMFSDLSNTAADDNAWWLRATVVFVGCVIVCAAVLGLFAVLIVLLTSVFARACTATALLLSKRRPGLVAAVGLGLAFIGLMQAIT